MARLLRSGVGTEMGRLEFEYVQRPRCLDFVFRSPFPFCLKMNGCSREG